MSTKNYKTWSKKATEAKELINQFDLFDSSNGKEGIDPQIKGQQITTLYETTESLQKFNPRYFAANFRNLVNHWTINKALTSGRRSKLFFVLFNLSFFCKNSNLNTFSFFRRQPEKIAQGRQRIS